MVNNEYLYISLEYKNSIINKILPKNGNINGGTLLTIIGAHFTQLHSNLCKFGIQNNSSFYNYNNNNNNENSNYEKLKIEIENQQNLFEQKPIISKSTKSTFISSKFILCNSPPANLLTIFESNIEKSSIIKNQIFEKEINSIITIGNEFNNFNQEYSDNNINFIYKPKIEINSIYPNIISNLGGDYLTISSFSTNKEINEFSSKLKCKLERNILMASNILENNLIRCKMINFYGNNLKISISNNFGNEFSKISKIITVFENSLKIINIPNYSTLPQIGTVHGGTLITIITQSLKPIQQDLIDNSLIYCQFNLI